MARSLVTRWEELGRDVAWPFWLLLLVVVPITSSPLVASFSGGETPVSPLALLPLIAVLVIWLIPYLISGSKLPSGVWPLIGFTCASLISALFSTRISILPFKDVNQLDRILRAFLTLGIGLGFYISAATFPSDRRRMILSMKAIYLGLFLMLIWSSVQAFIVLDGSDRMPLVVTRIHHLFSVRDPFPDRVTGMAFEPSWVGDQLVVLYIPILLGSVIQRWSVFPKPNAWVSVEALLLIWAFIILVLTKSRVSLLGVLIFILAVGLVVGFSRIRRSVRACHPDQKRSRLTLPVSYAVAVILLVSILLAIILSAGFILKQTDPRFTNLFSAPARLEEFQYFYPNEAIYELANELAFAERLVYWDFGFRTFADHPVLGVGPGNAGFFFERNIPPYGYGLTEIRNVIELEESGFPNPKNLWLRLLSETGILGFSIYFSWYALMGATSFLLWRKDGDVNKVLGFAGLMVFFTLFVEGFSLDTYALPQSWILFGFIALMSSSLFHQALPPELYESKYAS